MDVGPNVSVARPQGNPSVDTDTDAYRPIEEVGLNVLCRGYGFRFLLEYREERVALCVDLGPAMARECTADDAPVAGQKVRVLVPALMEQAG
jgi:hypothetical protein